MAFKTISGSGVALVITGALVQLMLASCSGSDTHNDVSKGGAAVSAGNSAAGSTAAGAGTQGGNSSAAGTSHEPGGSPTAGAGGAQTSGDAGAATGSGGASDADDVAAWIDDYKAKHPGNGGKDWDINAKTPEEVAADPDAQRLLDLCGPDQRPVIPQLAWEYGGADHQWMSPEASALVYCVYLPVSPSTEHWTYDDQADHVEADVYVLFPLQNPCKDEAGADQVMACLGDPSNVEILVDTASLNDGADAGLSLSEATTDLFLLSTDAGRVHMYTGL